MNLQLILEIFERKEFMWSIKVFVIFPVGSFDFAIMSGSKRPNEFMNDTTLFEACLKQRWRAAPRGKEIGKFRAIIGLDTLDREAECLEHMVEENSWRESGNLIEAFDITKARELVYSGILKLFMGSVIICSNNTTGWYMLHVDLHTLSGISHSFIRLGNIFRVWKLYGSFSQASEHAV